MIREKLTDNWKMKEIGADYSHEISVPNSVLSVLIDKGIIEDPYYRDNEKKCMPYLEKDYEFTRVFTVAGEYLREDEIDLVFNCLDTLTDIYLNGKKLACTENMHRTYRYNITNKIIAGSNELKIVFHSPLTYIKEYKSAPGKEISVIPCGCIKGNQFIRKAHSMFGWDWGPQLPDMGILGDVELQAYSKARISEVFFDQIHTGSRVSLVINPVLDITDNIPLEISVAVSGQKEETRVIRMPEAGEKYIPKGENEITIDIENPELWWPNGMGQQKLYKVKIKIKKSDIIYDEKEYKIGLRTITVSTQEDEWGKEFAFVVNGVKMFAMGADYIPEDALYTKINEEKIERLIKSSARANFNCIRVWGGGYYPTDTFYDLCDKYGLVVWQDLMYACNVYDMTPEFEENIINETKDNVARIRHHACLGLWCGNNEIESAWDHWGDFQKESPYLRADYIKMFEHVLPKAVREADDKTFYWPSSPSSGGCFDNPDDENRGDAHYWDVWHGQKPFTEYRNHHFRFLSEFGFQSFPCLKTVETFTEPEDRNIFSYVMEQHQKNGWANGKILYYISENFLYPSSFEGLLYISQILQGMAIKYGVEHFRRNRGRCMGTLFWQLNDNWPVASWSSVDYYGRWKALHYMARDFFEPIAASIRRSDVGEDGRSNKFKAFIVNDSQEPVSFRTRMSLMDMNGKEIIHYDETGRSLPGKVNELREHDFERYVKNHGAENVYIEMEIAYSNGRNSYLTETFVPYKHMKLLKPTLEHSVVEYEDSYEITIQSDVFTPLVMLDLKTRDGVFEDNIFSLAAKRPYVVYIMKSEINGEAYESADELNRDLSIWYIQKTYMEDDKNSDIDNKNYSSINEILERKEESDTRGEEAEENRASSGEEKNSEAASPGEEDSFEENETKEEEKEEILKADKAPEEDEFFDDEIEYPEYNGSYIENTAVEPETDSFNAMDKVALKRIKKSSRNDDVMLGSMYGDDNRVLGHVSLDSDQDAGEVATNMSKNAKDEQEAPRSHSPRKDVISRFNSKLDGIRIR